MAVIFGARHLVTNVDDELDRLANLSDNLGVEIQVLDAHLVFGREHIEVALDKSNRAFAQGRNIANTRGVELMLYAGAERQISKALDKMGLKEGLDELAIVVFGDQDPDIILGELGWVRDDSVLQPDPNRADEYGIDQNIYLGPDNDNIPNTRLIDHILEKMTLTELDR